jgi:leucyl-tRNA synthetase
MMEFINAWQVSDEGLDKKDLADFLRILSPFAPHLAEELLMGAGYKEMCCEQKWPKYDEKLIEETDILLIVQINGKVRDKIQAKPGLTQKEAERIVLKSEKIKTLIGQSEVKKIVFVPNKLINIVV